MEGNSKGWFPNGQQQFDYNFKNNQEHGVCTEWDPTGKKISELRFVDGAPVQDLLTGQRIRSEGEQGLETKQIVNEDKVKSATDLPEVPIKETEKPVNAPEAEIIEIPKVPQKPIPPVNQPDPTPEPPAPAEPVIAPTPPAKVEEAPLSIPPPPPPPPAAPVIENPVPAPVPDPAPSEGSFNPFDSTASSPSAAACGSSD